jgi:hypothetical protein
LTAKRPGAGRALARAALVAAFASCDANVILGVGPVPAAAAEVCDDGVDNDGDMLVDEGCTAGSPCPPMDARASGSCDRSFGFAWDGRSCVELRGCACAGTRCDSPYRSLEGCRADYETGENACRKPPPGEEICGDGVDNNGDERVDETCPAPCPPDAPVLPPDGCPDPKPLGFAWDGKACTPVVGCGCLDAKCAGLWSDLVACVDAHKSCLPSTCDSPVAPNPGAPDGSPVDVEYRFFDPAQCARLGDAACGPEGTPFSNECGCGCLFKRPEPIDPGLVRLLASKSPEECALRKVECQPPFLPFVDAGGGCGCAYRQECPRENDPGVTFLSDDPTFCANQNIKCEPGQFAFRGDCGCGCKPFDPSCSQPPDAYTSSDASNCRPTCEPGQRAFRDACGCGCLPGPAPGECAADLGDGGTVDYLDGSVENPAVCGVTVITCLPQEQPYFEPSCGCGCDVGTAPVPPSPLP